MAGGAEAAASLGGGLIGGVLGFMSNKANNKANAREAQKNRNFQAYMSNTAHQRETSDLIAAGLNPMLSATGGGGASTPGGSMATMQAPDIAGDVGRSVSSAVDTARMKKDLEVAETQKDNNQASTDLMQDQATNLARDRGLKDQQFEITKKQMPAVEAETAARVAQAHADQKKAIIDGKMTGFDAVNNRANQSADTLGKVLGVPGKVLGAPSSSREVEHRHTYQYLPMKKD